MTRELDEAYALHRSLAEHRDFRHRVRGLANAMRDHVLSRRGEALPWLESALADPERKWFVADVLGHLKQVPRRLLPAMIQAGVHEPDASWNRRFIEPCVQGHGYRRTIDAVVDLLVRGDAATRDGASRALYWAAGSYFGMEADVDVRRYLRSVLLREFLRNHEEDLRRRIAPRLSLRERDYPEEDAARLRQAAPHLRELQREARSPEEPLAGAGGIEPP